MKKKTQRDLLAPYICCYELKDKGGTLQGMLLQDNNDEGECALHYPEY